MRGDYLGVSHAALADLLGPLSPSVVPTSSAHPTSDLSADALETRFAWAALSTLVEPGDSDARLLAEALGAREALRAIVEAHESNAILDRIRSVDEAAALALGARLPAALDRWKPRLALATARRALTSAAQLRARLVTPADDHWPTTLDALGLGAPLALWARGDPAHLSELDRSIALVGARAATGYGEYVAMESAAALSDRGFAIISGGAYGIDGAAHRATLASDQTTVAFLAGGVDRLYPSGHSGLLQRIIDRGLVIGELPCGSPPTRWRFLQRNRLIAAVATATVVVEAGRRSGSLNTAGHAAMMGRPLGAVPGPVTSPASSGCHRLIREYDAVCVTSAAEMAELAGDPLDADTHVDRPRLADARTAGGDVRVAGGAAGGGHFHPSDRGLAVADVGGSRPDHSRPVNTSSRPPQDASGDRVPTRIDAEQTRLHDALSSRNPRTVTDLAARSGLSLADVLAGLGRLELSGHATEDEGGWRKTR